MPAVPENVLVVDPAATVTDTGTVSRTLLLDRAIEAPPVGAAWDSVTVQVVAAALVRFVGLHVSPVTVVGAAKEIDACCELPLYVAVTVAL